MVHGLILNLMQKIWFMFRIDRRRKLPVTTMLLGLDDAATAKKRAKLAAVGRDP